MGAKLSAVPCLRVVSDVHGELACSLRLCSNSDVSLDSSNVDDTRNSATFRYGRLDLVLFKEIARQQKTVVLLPCRIFALDSTENLVLV
jgi:hypothetical protein